MMAGKLYSRQLFQKLRFEEILELLEKSNNAGPSNEKLSEFVRLVETKKQACQHVTEECKLLMMKQISQISGISKQTKVAVVRLLNQLLKPFHEIWYDYILTDIISDDEITGIAFRGGKDFTVDFLTRLIDITGDKLSVLSVYDCDIGDECIAMIPKLPKLVRLCLSKCKLTKDGINALANAISTNDGLMCLDISETPLNVTSCKTLADAIRNRPNFTLVTHKCNLYEKCGQVLLQLLEDNPAIALSTPENPLMSWQWPQFNTRPTFVPLHAWRCVEDCPEHPRHKWSGWTKSQCGECGVARVPLETSMKYNDKAPCDKYRVLQCRDCKITKICNDVSAATSQGFGEKPFSTELCPVKVAHLSHGIAAILGPSLQDTSTRRRLRYIFLNVGKQEIKTVLKQLFPQNANVNLLSEK